VDIPHGIEKLAFRERRIVLARQGRQ